MKQTAIIFIIFVLLAIIGITGFYYMTAGPDLSKFENLRNPRISIKQDQQMLVVETKGDPNEVSQKAFGLLFKLYFKIKGTPKGPGQSAPRARWQISPGAARTEWIGWYAMPVPEDIMGLPEYEAEPGMTVSITTWEYGNVGEILHIGPYNQEEPDIKRLMDYITAQGYRVTGAHEEEYLKGPTMFSKGNPEKYVTIIRYRVTKSE